jgi:hypothetical protein
MAHVRQAPSDEPLVLSWWERRPRRRYRIVASVAAADLVPERLPRKALVTVETDHGPAWLAFDCPCRRRHRLLIPLAPGKRPHWVLTGSKSVSLHPSVDSHDAGERCHFWLTDGRIQWAGRPGTKETVR